MNRAWWLAFGVLATMLAQGSGAWAKPSDHVIQCLLFDDEPVKGRFSIELGISSMGLTFKFGAAPAMPEPPAVIDAVCPSIVPAYVRALINRMRSVFAPQEAEESSAMDPESLYFEMRGRTIPLGLAQQATY